ncbi:MAG: formylmethanofuran dehydrogenase subunit C [Planctomycetota bacterium]
MNRRIEMTLRQSIDQSVDATPCRADRWATQSIDDIRRTQWFVDGRPDEIGHWFHVDSYDDARQSNRIDWIGDFQNVHRIGHQHRLGQWTIEGHAGNEVGSCMTAGRIDVMGNAGDRAGSSSGSRGSGMNGGILTIHGNAGMLAGHRMRRGELRVGGCAGEGLGSLMIAGTIQCAGSVGQNLGVGMRRGTIILSQRPRLPEKRFTNPAPLQTPFQTILARQRGVLTQSIRSMLHQDLYQVRGDRSMQGQGEVWFPAPSDPAG